MERETLDRLLAEHNVTFKGREAIRAFVSRLSPERQGTWTKALPTGWGYYYRRVHYSNVPHPHWDIVRVWSLPDGSKTFAPTSGGSTVNDLEVGKHEEYFGVPIDWSGPIPEPGPLSRPAPAPEAGIREAAEEAPPTPEPTHRCKVCGALWKLWQPGEAKAGDAGSWSLVSARCGKCCDNVAMGDQIERILLSRLGASGKAGWTKEDVDLRAQCCIGEIARAAYDPDSETLDKKKATEIVRDYIATALRIYAPAPKEE